ncbi:SIR2 family NAD-dependent protein deacylase [Pseudomonas helleri]|uniref:SIR2 family NAD-dependent protein deacylase n=1 Tax=Pseudomonas helleri TaxID=1608996 RepID=UPI003FD3441C
MTALEIASNALLNAKKIVCFSGAGISVESGIPTYREKLTGLWARHNPEHLETAKAFRENPSLVWGWYLWRRQQFSKAQPNAAHLALHEMAGSMRTVSIITQNIDDLHERAGSIDVLHLHGSLSTPKCFACHRPGMVRNELAIMEEGALVEPPRCTRCNGKLRPGVVWYGENLLPGVWKSALSLVKSCDVLISVGTSGVVTPAADLPDIALACGATVIHVNTVDVGMGAHNEIMLSGRASQILSHLSAFLSRELNSP